VRDIHNCSWDAERHQQQLRIPEKFLRLEFEIPGLVDFYEFGRVGNVRFVVFEMFSIGDFCLREDERQF
jgi:hypothetical protein